MRSGIAGWVALAVMASAGFAAAQAAPQKGALDELDARITALAVKPLPGREKAAPQAPAYCPKGGEYGGSIGAIARSIENMGSAGEVIKAAGFTCTYAKEPVVQKAVALSLQNWINWTGLTVAEAQESLRLRMDETRFAADQEKLCKTFEVSDEEQGEARIFKELLNDFFGRCSDPARWLDGRLDKTGDALYFIDQSNTPVDPIVRVALVADATKFAVEGTDDPKQALQALTLFGVDFRDLDLAKAKAKANEAPYKGNTYARAVILETVAYARVGMAAVNAAAKKLSADASWKSLFDAAVAGAAAYERDATKYADALATSNAYEKTFWGPSKKANKGCYEKLVKDFSAVMKPLKRSNPKELEISLSQPIPALLFRRLAACATLDMTGEFASKLRTQAVNLRASRGPRHAAYYATLDALSEVLADRAKFPVTAKSFWFSPTDLLMATADRLDTEMKEDQMGYLMEGAGQVKSVKKAGGKTTIAWVTSKRQVMTFRCTSTNRIQRIDSSGNVIYQENCREAGMVWEDTTPEGVTMNDAFVSGVAAGTYVDFVAGRGNDPSRPGMPAYVYKDKSKKELINFYGIKLN